MIKLKHFCLATLFSVTALAQTPVRETLLQQANRQFDTQSYAKAVSLYQEAFEESILPLEQRQLAQLNVAYSYFQLGDNAKAEEFYQQALPEEQLSGSLTSHYLHYAKVLAINGKMQESQRFFERYQNTKLNENRQIQSAETFTKKRITYRLDYLAINTSNAEFSPIYFRDGLVFVSGKAPAAVSSEAPEKGYLDLFYVTKPDEIKSLSSLNADGSEAEVKENSHTDRTKNKKLGSDSYTRITSNDSRTIGTFNSYGLNEQVNNTDGAVAKPGKPEPFSKELNTRFHEGPATY
jgi:tetratricopeptide (TPR) repeat protein